MAHMLFRSFAHPSTEAEFRHGLLVHRSRSIIGRIALARQSAAQTWVPFCVLLMTSVFQPVGYVKKYLASSLAFPAHSTSSQVESSNAEISNNDKPTFAGRMQVRAGM